MEDKDFDRIIKEKLSETDVPQYKESKWIAFSKLLPGSSHKSSNWLTYSLLALLILSNLAWWRIYENYDLERSEFQSDLRLAMSKEESNENVIRTIVYDTVYRTIEIEKTIYKTNYIEDVSQSQLATTFNNATNLTSELTSRDNSSQDKESNKGEANGAVAQIDDSSNNDHNQEITFLTDSLEEVNGKSEHVDRSAGAEADSIEADSIKDETTIHPEDEKLDLIPRKKDQYLGDRILAGVQYYKPFSLSDAAKEFGANDFVVSLEYIFNNWIRFSGGINYSNQKYSITDQSFFNDILAKEDEEFYELNNPYGNGYSFINSSISVKNLHLNLGMQLSPLKNETWRPFAGIYYLESLSSQSDVTNRLSENSSGKIILVESIDPRSLRNNFIQTELGVEMATDYQLRFRLGLDYRIPLRKEKYIRDLIGIKAGFFYRMK